jgi:hypothetical protein
VLAKCSHLDHRLGWWAQQAATPAGISAAKLSEDALAEVACNTVRPLTHRELANWLVEERLAIRRADGRLEATRRDKARWVYLPAWLIEFIEKTCPMDDRTPERRVFQGITEARA